MNRIRDLLRPFCRRWKRFIGFRPRLTCSPQGFVATAAIAPDPVSLQTTVYVSAPDGSLYTLNAEDGSDAGPRPWSQHRARS